MNHIRTVFLVYIDTRQVALIACAQTGGGSKREREHVRFDFPAPRRHVAEPDEAGQSVVTSQSI